MKTGAIEKIEQKMAELDESSVRYHILDTCRKFKTNWMELGQGLFSVHRDKLFQEWGYLGFEQYCSSELGIKKATAVKLLKSYQFLEHHEPSYLEKVKKDIKAGDRYADVEAVNALRLAQRNQNIDQGQYSKLRSSVLDDAKDATDVRKEVRMMCEQTQAGGDPEVIRADRRQKFLGKFVKQLESAKLEAMGNRFLPDSIIDLMDDLSGKVERELNRD